MPCDTDTERRNSMYSDSKKFDDEYIRYVLQTYSDMLIRLCLTYVKNRHDAEDMAEDTFCELVRHRPVFESSEHEKAWLIRCAVNKCKNYLRSARVRLTDSIEDLQTEIAAPEESDSGGTVTAAVLSLPEKYRTIIHLFYYEEYSINEIAKILSMSPSTVGTRLDRGRQMLKKKIQQAGGELDV